MRKLRGYVTIILVVSFLVCTGTAGFGQDIRARMKSRLPEIAQLKAKGIVGENNQGFLQFMGASKEKEALVIEENNDRRVAYAAIAKREGTTAAFVGKRRAIQLLEMANRGDWVQNAAGQWRQKK